MPTTRRANVIGDSTILDRMPAAAFRVASWDNKRSPKAQRQVSDWCEPQGLLVERVFDANYTRRYVAFVYYLSDFQRARQNCFAAIA